MSPPDIIFLSLPPLVIDLLPPARGPELMINEERVKQAKKKNEKELEEQEIFIVDEIRKQIEKEGEIKITPRPLWWWGGRCVHFTTNIPLRVGGVN